MHLLMFAERRGGGGGTDVGCIKFSKTFIIKISTLKQGSFGQF